VSSELAKNRQLLVGAILLPVMLGGLFAFNPQPFGPGAATGQLESSDSLTRMREALLKNQVLLANYEQEQSNLRVEVIKRRQLYQSGRISKAEVEQAEQAFVAALRHVHEMREAVTEADIAITEAVLGEKVQRLPALPVNGYSETSEWARFNGGSRWSLREAQRIETFFSQSFGHRLPVTALGQSDTHNRLGFDHHESMDVALHPDSTEGKALINYLRKTGTPFIAFRSAVPGASTGPHIHVGRPSGRLARR
jgi:hypothetical protein